MSGMFTVFKDEALEAAARDAIRLDGSRALLDRFGGRPDLVVVDHHEGDGVARLLARRTD